MKITGRGLPFCFHYDEKIKDEKRIKIKEEKIKENKMNTPIYHQLMQLEKEKRIPFHMPGHKRRGEGVFTEIASVDITEITGYDNLHDPEGMIRSSMNQLKEIYGTKESWYLINGSTVGILAAISACCTVGDGILLSRNCHKAVYNAIRLLHLHPYYFSFSIHEKYDLVQDMPKKAQTDLEEILKKHGDIKAVIFPSPTYEGVVMDVRAIKKITEKAGVPLIVDEAHGAHFVFHDYFPDSAINCGADLVIQSTHKTLPSMTQTALLHLCTDKISPEKITDRLSIYETSSPSYVLMASAEYGVAYMRENRDKVQEYVDNLIDFRKKCAQLKNIHLIEKEEINSADYDRGKLVFSVKNTEINGDQLFSWLLDQFGIELEMADRFNGIAMTSVCDTKEEYDLLFHGLMKIDKQIYQRKKKEIDKEKKEIDKENQPDIPEKIMESWESEDFGKREVSLENAIGEIAASFILLYPPGIPLLVPGEKIVKETVENIRYYLYNGYNVLGLSGQKKNKMEVLYGRDVHCDGRA